MSDSISEIDRIHRRLEDLLRSDPHLAQPVAYYHALAGLLHSGPLLASLPVDFSTARERLAAGQLLLGGARPTFDRAKTENFFRQVCRLLIPYRSGIEAAEVALDEGRLDLVNLLETLLSSPSNEPGGAEDASEDGGLTLRVLLEYTLRPTLRDWSRQLARAVPLEDWQRATCPVCGNLPLLAEYHRSSQQRLLRCAFCGTAWSYPLRKCVYCTNEDPQSQALIANHNDPRLFVQTCKRCRVYIKSIFTEEVLPHDLLSLEDLASLYLDNGCQKSGYLRLSAARGSSSI